MNGEPIEDQVAERLFGMGAKYNALNRRHRRACNAVIRTLAKRQALAR